MFLFCPVSLSIVLAFLLLVFNSTDVPCQLSLCTDGSIAYYGTREGHEDQKISHNSTLVVSGNNAALVQFSSKEEALWHMVLYHIFKKQISDIGNEVCVSGFTGRLLEDRPRREWIPATDLFHQVLGKGACAS